MKTLSNGITASSRWICFQSYGQSIHKEVAIWNRLYLAYANLMASSIQGLQDEVQASWGGQCILQTSRWCSSMRCLLMELCHGSFEDSSTSNWSSWWIRRLDPFLSKIGLNAYNNDLPPSMCMNPIFYISNVSPFHALDEFSLAVSTWGEVSYSMEGFDVGTSSCSWPFSTIIGLSSLFLYYLLVLAV